MQMLATRADERPAPMGEVAAELELTLNATLPPDLGEPGEMSAERMVDCLSLTRGPQGRKAP